MRDEMLGELADAIVSLDDERAIKLTMRSMESGIDPVVIIERGLSRGLRVIGERFARGEAFIPHVMIGAEIMKEAVGVLEPELLKRKGERKSAGRVLIGTAEGDIHDIGKNIVGTMLSVEGFEVIDLGKDVPTGVFVEKTRELNPDIVGVSALMTTTLPKQREVVNALKEAGLRERVRFIVGGAAVTEGWAKEISADGYAEDALRTVALCKKLLKSKN